MDATSIPSPDLKLETLLSIWPIARNLSQWLPVGDLISLSRSSVTLRAVLHGFETPRLPPQDREELVPSDPGTVRDELHIGQHGTIYWQQLKDQAPFECSSRTHTKGPTPKPCRYCSKPICDACIVRSSFARGHENTFQNRTRYLCSKCWETGNSSQSERFPLLNNNTSSPDPNPPKRKWYDPDGSTKDYCTCTLKDDGWLCLDCKDLQNQEALSITHCHGKDCREPLEADKERRRICLWCNKALPRQIGGTTRYHWNQKMVEARARNAASRQADLEEYNKRRLKLMRMSRREMRGDEAVKDDPDADVPQFVRHLDTLNYRSYMSDAAAPSGDAIYDSKRGYWRYTREFLLEMGTRCRCARLPPPPQIKAFCASALTFARTNGQLSEEMLLLTPINGSKVEETRLKQWYRLKAVVLELLLVQKLGYKEAQRLLQEEYGFSAPVKEYRQALHQWYIQLPVKELEYRRPSLVEQEAVDVEHGSSSSLGPLHSAEGNVTVERNDASYSVSETLRIPPSPDSDALDLEAPDPEDQDDDIAVIPVKTGTIPDLQLDRCSDLHHGRKEEDGEATSSWLPGAAAAAAAPHTIADSEPGPAHPGEPEEEHQGEIDDNDENPPPYTAEA
ncbi:hypothetical protein HRR83_007910 [Exophiala dermatitidis]|uniref:Clr5 domain-containing protein n=2 Tax=Exophiala dermatitidis TaxID=5970 RepID=H6BUF3_EXODN|nr:uncharacterized protein HMPREF1120_03820 [Exophiala dermatitidis NIH/UT8656]KAJ4506574.1 hypothetical protein HRR75_006816 [Exophiala dermatitidis]EHY55695.1 hypothetical protein HMPREF1120_03820 [Exophiala dermatitidis NIH/UT8656]KAJ4508843.1 hypothetical protein HRR74_007435 [Exophiala dermatitidis]KAJ4510095.1 hypothetical protein HRR73_006893 [Exophiala dermatitidis]KAJ4539098.1 hypothetical protein HRR77_006514 [Exophiala dermatitidis]